MDETSSTECLRKVTATVTGAASAAEAPRSLSRSLRRASASAAAAVAISRATRAASSAGTPARARSDSSCATGAPSSASTAEGTEGSRASAGTATRGSVSSACFAAKRQRSNACGGGAPAPAATPAAFRRLRSLSRAVARAHSNASACAASRATAFLPAAVVIAGGGAHLGTSAVTSHSARFVPLPRMGRPRPASSRDPPPPNLFSRRGAFVCACAGRVVVADRGPMSEAARRADGDAERNRARVRRCGGWKEEEEDRDVVGWHDAGAAVGGRRFVLE